MGNEWKTTMKTLYWFILTKNQELPQFGRTTQC
jgi:hypothetical protein